MGQRQKRLPEILVEPIWERQQYETAAWFSRFLAYLLLGKDRSAVIVYNDERIANGKPEASQPNGGWNEHTVGFKWVLRAEAWDLYEVERIAEERQETISAWSILQERVLRTLFAKLTQRIENIDVDDLPANKLVADFLASLKALKEEYGIQPANKVELTGPDGSPVQVSVEDRRKTLAEVDEFRKLEEKVREAVLANPELMEGSDEGIPEDSERL